MNAGQSEENIFQAWEQTDHEAIWINTVARTTRVYLGCVPPTPYFIS